MAELLFTRDQIKVAVNDVATAIAYSGFKPDLILVVMTGGLRFASDLSERLHFHEINPEISFITGLGESPAFAEGQKVLIVDDIHDSGRTIERLRLELKGMDAAEVRVATLIYRERQDKSTKPDYFGLKLSSMLWLYGYGLDLDFRERGNPCIYGIPSK